MTLVLFEMRSKLSVACITINKLVFKKVTVAIVRILALTNTPLTIFIFKIKNKKKLSDVPFG